MKNIIISALGAALAIRIIPWFACTTPMEQTGIFTGVFVLLIIFCFFCEEMAEKWRKYRERVQEITDSIARLLHHHESDREEEPQRERHELLSGQADADGRGV